MKLLRPFAAALLVLAVGLMLPACHLFSHKPRPVGPAVTGTVVYITNVQLPADATIELKLLELTRDGAVVQEISSDTLPRPRSVPVSFELLYNKHEISRHHFYGMDAKILSCGKALFTLPRPSPVLTHGNPAQVELVVEPAKPAK